MALLLAILPLVLTLSPPFVVLVAVSLAVSILVFVFVLLSSLFVLLLVLPPLFLVSPGMGIHHLSFSKRTGVPPFR
jgi:hypothetical protein